MYNTNPDIPTPSLHMEYPSDFMSSAGTKVFEVLTFLKPIVAPFSFVVGPVVIIWLARVKSCHKSRNIIFILAVSFLLKLYNTVQLRKIENELEPTCANLAQSALFANVFNVAIVTLEAIETYGSNEKGRNILKCLLSFYLTAVCLGLFFLKTNQGAQLLHPVVQTTDADYYFSLCAINTEVNKLVIILEYVLLWIPFAIGYIVLFYRNGEDVNTVEVLSPCQLQQDGCSTCSFISEQYLHILFFYAAGYFIRALIFICSISFHQDLSDFVPLLLNIVTYLRICVVFLLESSCCSFREEHQDEPQPITKCLEV